MHPLLYEINTRCWLRALSEQSGKSITLANVPEAEFQRWQKLGFTHIWLMGVWMNGPRSRAATLGDSQLRAALEKISPGCSEENVPGSPYAISNYEVASGLGGEAGLKAFRKKINAAGMKLLLDFVPNHMGLDHPWLAEKPDLFVQGVAGSPGTFLQNTPQGPRYLAHGKDPFFAPWPDTVQLDYRRTATQAAMTALLQSVAHRCDGVRCDMAMLVLREVFAKTWASFPPQPPETSAEFWTDAIPAVKKANPGFLFLAEAYWGLEGRLHQCGFDYTYDKELYDRLLDHRYAELQKNLLEAPPAHLAGSAHFLENHDERRIASVLSVAQQRAATLLMLGLPGMRFVHQGQMEGRRFQVPVHLGYKPDEPVNPEIKAMHEQILPVLKTSAVGRGDWQMPRPTGWPDNSSAQNFVIVQWKKEPGQFDLVVVNLAPQTSQCQVQLALEDGNAAEWEMRDLLGKEVYRRKAADLKSKGLFFELPGNGAQLFHFQARN